MQEERAYVEWLRGQEEKKDTKPAVQLVSKYTPVGYTSL